MIVTVTWWFILLFIWYNIF